MADTENQQSSGRLGFSKVRLAFPHDRPLYLVPVNRASQTSSLRVMIGHRATTHKNAEREL